MECGKGVWLTHAAAVLPAIDTCFARRLFCVGCCSRRMQCIYVDREKKGAAAGGTAAAAAGSAAANGDSSSSSGRPLTPDRAAAVAAAGGDAAGTPAADVGVSGICACSCPFSKMHPR
jgi:hypothetical protein